METSATESRLSRLGRFLARHRNLLLLLAVVLSVALAWPASRLKLDESIESFYSPNDPYLLAYERSKATFGGDAFVLIAYPVDEATSEDVLRETREFAAQLSEVPGVRSESTQSLAYALRNPNASGWIRLVMRLPTTERALMKLSRRVLVGDDDRTVAIILRLEDVANTTVPRSQTFREIRHLAESHDPTAFVAGEPIQVHDMFRYVQRDGWVLGLASSGLLMLVILVLFRSLRWVLLPIVIIHATLIWTKGILELSGLQLSMVSSMLTSLVTIIGIATVMHVTVTFREFRRDYSRADSFRKTFEQLAQPIFWTCLTTAIGFGSLLTSMVTPVRSFAVMMALGTLLVPVLCLLVLPFGILSRKGQADPQHPWGEGTLVASLQKLADAVLARPVMVLGMTVVLTVAGVIGLGRLRVETDFSKNFREGSPIVQSLEFVEQNLGGAGTWEVAFDAPRQLNEAFLDRVRTLAEELRKIELPDGTQLTKVVALTDGLDMVPRIPVESNGRGGLFSAIPRFRLANLDERRELLSELQPEMEISLYSPEKGRMRIVLRAEEQQPAETKLRLIHTAEAVAQKEFPEAQATGLYVLLAYLITSLLQDQVVSFTLAASGVALCLTFAFRSVRVGLISLVPNVLPILVVIGGMGWFGLPINIGTAMIASVSMGLTVDSTIHYLTAYRRGRAAGKSHQQAIREAHGSVGLALSLANLALVIGFSVLALSSFVPLVYFGALVSVAMVGGLIGNLVLLPVLLRWESAPQAVDSSPDPIESDAAS